MVPSLKIHRKNNCWLLSQCPSFSFYQAISFQKIKKIQTVCGQGPSKTRAMLAKIDFVMILMVLHNWLCNSQLYWEPSSYSSYSMVLIAISHLLRIIDDFTTCGEHSSMVDLFLSMRSVPSRRICFKFWYAAIKRGRQFEVNAKWTMMQQKFRKVLVVLVVLGHAESGYSL